ncbi:hypothetical protein PPYR_09059 [Photinus pyralis]|uniref:Cathepsin L n=2 Tax=Photinus pyralis TaxID=7054 RepID=A0A5N4AL83_PHOPY|nr:cathepsin L1-like [Photinus pyralis]KAB0798066.1 hypothetical protein PPYR_09059 [Photinus pyralis]
MFLQALRIFVVVLYFKNITSEKNDTKTIHTRQTPTNFDVVRTETRRIPLLTAVPRLLTSPQNYFQTDAFGPQQSFSAIPQKTIRIQAPAVKSKVQIITSLSTDDILELEWSNFKKTFQKNYSTLTEDRQRKEIFIENRNKVAKFNQAYGFGYHSFVKKLNEYADMLHHEFNHQLNGFNRTDARGRSAGSVPSAFIRSENAETPIRVDWSEFGAVSSVKSQGKCGACYAFASAGALEGQHFRKTGQLLDLSVQNIIDCSTPYSNNGCVGGVMDKSYEYIKDNKGVATEAAYPFEGKDGLECRYTPEKYGAHATGHVVIDEGDENSLESAVAHLGPVSVAIDASPDSFQFYSSGVYFEPSCQPGLETLNHAVLVVGYGTEPNGQDYWLIKNSYGAGWGIGGYMKIAKFANNHCGIASFASYPLV